MIDLEELSKEYYKTANISHLTQRDLSELKKIIESDVESIQDQLDDAKDRAAKTGQYADQQWFRKAQDAIKYKRRYIHRINQYLDEVGYIEPDTKPRKGREEGRGMSAAWNKQFVKAAKTFLSSSDFLAISSKVNRQMGSRQSS